MGQTEDLKEIKKNEKEKKKKWKENGQSKM
jgi:hypothetical protein